MPLQHHNQHQPTYQSQHVTTLDSELAGSSGWPTSFYIAFAITLFVWMPSAVRAMLMFSLAYSSLLMTMYDYYFSIR